MKTTNQKNNNVENENESDINWVVVGPVIAVLLAALVMVFL